MYYSTLEHLYKTFNHTCYHALTLKVDGRGAGSSLAGRGLDRVSGVVACARQPGYGPPLGDNWCLAKGDDRVLVFQTAVMIQ